MENRKSNTEKPSPVEAGSGMEQEIQITSYAYGNRGLIKINGKRLDNVFKAVLVITPESSVLHLTLDARRGVNVTGDALIEFEKIGEDRPQRI